MRFAAPRRFSRIEPGRNFDDRGPVRLDMSDEFLRRCDK
jgi:hypothetical protein